MTEADAPWAFVKGLPAGKISTLELLASTVGLLLLAPERLSNEGAIGAIAITGLTDSQVAAKVLQRGISTKFPLCCVAMELAARLEARQADLELEWVPRAANAEADRLADGVAHGFDEAHRVGCDLGSLPWLVLPDLLAAGAVFYASRTGPVEACGKAGGAAASRRLAGDRLREREPW